MYLLDTNVVAELRKAKAGKANKGVTAWANSVAPASLFLSSFTVRDGTWRFTHGTARSHPAFAERVLAIDITIARRCAQLHVPDRR
jgi:toxin FitB